MIRFKLKITKVIFAMAICSMGTLVAHAQRKGMPPATQPENTPTDSTKKNIKVKVRPYKDVITSAAVSSKGIFTVHCIDDKYFFEIPFNMMQQDMLIINRIAAAAADMRLGSRSTTGYAGDPIGGIVVRFERGPANKLFVRKISYSEYAKDSSSSMYAAVTKNTVQPIIAAFPIAAYNPDSTSLVIDVTDYLNSDNDMFNFTDQISKMIFHVGAQQNDKSYLKYVHVYPKNLEIRSVKTYTVNGSTRSGNYTLELNSSLVLLPQNPMKARYYDERVGYFTTDYMDFDANPQGIKQQSIANRWRLEPKPEDIEKYKRGELVEPQKPIVYYIDPATPAKWVPYLIQGVDDWNAAFTHAGFKNAISARLAPTPAEDPSFSLEDARHSAIIYKPSPVPNASGPSIADPRTGEIMESHINWYHNVMSLIHNWYMIQCGAVDPRARKMEFDDSLMGELIRFVSSHEVGHTLGLRHNFGSSSTVPVDSLRNKKWVEANGHTPSIMDYARFNYVAQPEDNIDEKGLFPRIGDYDNWAVEWGYKWYDTKTAEEDETVLNRLTSEKMKNKRLWFGTELSPADPRSQSEDLGDNAMKAGEYGIKNLKRILPKLAEWTKTPNEGYENLTKLYVVLNSQLDRYIVHVLKNIAGVYATPKTTDQPGAVYELEPVQKQKDAMAFLDEYVFTTPTWLYDKNILDKTGQNFVSLIIERQGGVINSMIGTYRMSRMINAEATYGKANVYTMEEYLKDLDHAILKELYHAKPIDVYRRNLQKIYIDKLLSLAYPPQSNNIIGPRATDAPDGPESSVAETLPAKYSDISSVIKGQLKAELALLKKALPTLPDAMSKEHVEDLIARINNASKEAK